VIRKLRDAGKLTYADDEARAGMDEIARRGLDRRANAPPDCFAPYDVAVGILENRACFLFGSTTFHSLDKRD
jgi:hypothetical protein